MNWIVAGLACGSTTVAAATFLGARLKIYLAPATRSSGDLAEFSLSRYEPMTRLLTGDDLEFLKAQKGYRPEIGEKFRRDRLRMFRLYLADLAVDFRSLHASARELVAHSGAENAGLVGSLLRQQVTFWRAILAIELRLTIGGMGFDSSLATEVRGLISALEAMRLEISHLDSAPGMA